MGEFGTVIEQSVDALLTYQLHHHQQNLGTFTWMVRFVQ